MAPVSSTGIWKTYGFWALWVGVAFSSIYPTCNWLTSQRSHLLALYLEAELTVPFVPEFVWVYVSIYVLFLSPTFFLDVPRLKMLGRQLIATTLFSGLIFILFPAKLGFPRTIPEDSFYGPLFATIFAVDLPYNMVPSLHIVFSALILWAILDASKLIRIKIVAGGWLILLCASTLFVHQHHILDVIAGLGVASLLRHWIRIEEDHA